jgi:hypothetical protein
MTRDLTDDIDDILDSITNRQIETSIKKSRGLNGRSQWLIKNMIPIVKAAKPITGRGVGYKLFVAKLIKSMSQNDMQRVYRLLKVAREQGMIPWGSIVDEARQLERRPSWPNPKEFVESAVRQYRREFLGTATIALRGVGGEGHDPRRAATSARCIRRGPSSHAWLLQRNHRQRCR